MNNIKVPYSPEAEIAVIGSIFNDCAEGDIMLNLIAAGVRKDYFFEQRNQNHLILDFFSVPSTHPDLVVTSRED